jgi:K+-sensing histidine kinase KdpD
VTYNSSRFFAASLGIHGILSIAVMNSALDRYPTTIGVALSAVAALIVSLFFARVSHSAVLPLLFAVVQVAIAARFGVKVSVVGSILAGAIFAIFLYSPTGSLYVENGAARANIAWMVLASIAVSYLLLPEKNDHAGHHPAKSSNRQRKAH